MLAQCENVVKIGETVEIGSTARRRLVDRHSPIWHLRTVMIICCTRVLHAALFQKLLNGTTTVALIVLRIGRYYSSLVGWAEDRL
jgi:hypothetical protein